MLVNLDNEIHFKNVFTDVEVFKGFVKDVLGLDLEIDKVETEKELCGQVGPMNFKTDLFAEDKKKRTIIEIQKVDYDYAHKRFLHYFPKNTIGLPCSDVKNYRIDKTVYTILVITRAYDVVEKLGEPTKDYTPKTKIAPQKIDEQLQYNQTPVILNIEFIDENTSQNIRDWSNLIKESIDNPKNPNINLSKPIITRAAQLAETENIDPDLLHNAYLYEMRKAALAFTINRTLEKKQKELKSKKIQSKIDNAIKNALHSGIEKSQIVSIFGVSLEVIEELEKEI